jgi:CRP-like cAMP-binding protein
VIEQLHYTLQVENHEGGARVFSEGSECRQVYFVTSGALELFVEDGREQRTLDSLGPGSWIGAYTVLNASSFKFSARAKGSLSLLVLHPQALFNISNEEPALDEAIEEGTDFIIDNETPVCDYYIAD